MVAETWCCGYTGQVLADYSSTSVSYTLGTTPVKAFGFFAEPDPYEILAITLDLSDGGTVTQDVNGEGGASFFGWVGGGVTGFTVSSSTDFAVGDLYSSIAVPEPSKSLGDDANRLRRPRLRRLSPATQS